MGLVNTIALSYSDYKNNTNNLVEIDFDLKVYLNLIHQEQSDFNYVSLFKIQKNKNIRWGIKTSELDFIQNFIDEPDFYISVNEFFRCDKPTARYLKSIKAFYIDLDYYNIDYLKDLSVSQLIELIKEDADYPMPSFYVDTGRGLHIYWLLNKTSATEKTKKYWRKVQKALIEKFNDFGVDKKVKDTARVLRLVSSINSKTNKKVKLILENSVQKVKRYEISEIAEYLWGPCETWKTYDKNKKTNKNKKLKRNPSKKDENKLKKLKSIQMLHFSRIQDFETLVQIRPNLKGFREQLLFLYRLQLSFMNKSNEESLNATLKLNKKMEEPLEESEVISSTKSAEDNAEIYLRLKQKWNEKMGISLNKYLSMNGVYLYKNSTIIKMLEITEIEQKQMQTLIGAEEKKCRKKIRNEEFYENNKKFHKEYYEKYNKTYYKNKLKKDKKLSRAEQNENKRIEIQKLLKKGLSQRMIAKKMKMSVSNINRHIKKIN